MPRKDFITDLNRAQDRQGLPDDVVSISPGLDDGNILLLFRSLRPSQQLRLQLQISDVGDYPRSHSFFVFSDSEDLPEDVASGLSKITTLLERISISDAVLKISAALNGAGDEESPNSIDAGTDLLEEEDEDEDEDDNYDDDQYQEGEQEVVSLSYSPNKQNDRAFSDGVRQDFRVLKEAGFRVSYDGPILKQGFSCSLMISIHVYKLEIPKAALEAWHLRPSDYIMLLLKYRHGYCGLERLHDSSSLTQDIDMFILVTKHHKLTSEEVRRATDRFKGRQNASETPRKSDGGLSVRPMFISSALEELLNSRLFALIRYRLNLGLDWDGAMAYHNDMQGALRIEIATPAKYFAEQDVSKIEALPRLLRADHIRESANKTPAVLSLPCIAMQFALRHVVRCTEFCLVCFDRTNDSFEALKPYVCSKPLCLFQYMSMGFGPGIEFEILSQKYVADLLVSFCYAATSTVSLPSLPIGLGLMVPDPDLVFGVQQLHEPTYLIARTPLQRKSPLSIPPKHKDVLSGQWHLEACQIVLAEPSKKTVKIGEWIAFWGPDQCLRHCQITDVHQTTYRYESVIVSIVGTSPFPTSSNAGKSKSKDLPLTDLGPIPINIVLYRRLLDSMTKTAQHVAIRMMLDTLPSVDEMVTYLQTNHDSMQGKLDMWKERMIPSTLGILRWIIASNRSCIVQEKDNRKLVHGMPGYFQFRFASGAPDKESRFVNCVNEVGRRLKTSHPTIFAWHGSPVGNWHSIIREGLNFDRVAHGRSFGHGVYHSLLAHVSIGYATNSFPQNWPSSKLCIQAALSLNEIVNAPKEFTSKDPYLVVQDVDWVQTRYLFVKCNDDVVIPLAEPPNRLLAQDVFYYPKGVGQVTLLMPDLSDDRSQKGKLDLRLQKARKTAPADSPGDQDNEMSDESDAAELLETRSKRNESELPNLDLTPFRPGSLDRSKLPMLTSPTFATPMSSKILQRALQLLLKEQQETPLSELGWYLDPEHIDNVYQWIVELHSFSTTLPLAEDMKAQGIESIVLELRFGPNFNFSPPFIRVVRPRFLEFAMGGGGHVTAGGALCMQLLTSDGWNPSSTIAAVLLQIRMAITSTDPRPARLNRARVPEYTPYEAIEAYKRACLAHGWKVPDDLESIVAMSGHMSSGLASVIPQKRSASTL